MDTRPKDGQPTDERGAVYASKEKPRRIRYPRLRFFAEARKRDDRDAEAHRGEALTPHSAEKIGAAAGVVHE